MSLSMKQKQTHSHREQTCGCQGGVVGGGMWEVGVSRGEMFHPEWVNKNVLLYSTRNYMYSISYGKP